ncbi:hypothetical protein [Candidatus Poriferisocius sp.]|uniref:hypothetical protein n=1 Tax=Candidatus Poriferisocius sp. TaxID=3101276 RepID=UPI003B51641F
MKRRSAHIADFFRSMTAKLRGARSARRGAVPGPRTAKGLSLVLVAVTVFAASLVFASPSSAHEVSPEHSCETGKLVGDQCETATEATSGYSCETGKLVGDQCESPSGVDATADCPSGTLTGDECLHTANPTYSCDTGTLNGNRCVHTASPVERCPSGTLTDDECLHTANPTYSCDTGTLNGNRCVHTASPAERCPSGTLTDDECLHTANPTYSCDTGTLNGNRCVHTASPAERCPSGTLTDDECLHTANPTYSCDTGTLNGNRCVHTASPAERCPSGTLTDDECLHTANPTYSCDTGTLNGNRCVHTASPAERCPSGTLTDDECLHTANPTYSCRTGTLNGNRCVHTISPAERCPSGTLTDDECLHTANPTYSCRTGTLSGSRCLHTASPSYSCSSGTLSGSRCVTTTTTAASARCSSGRLSGGRCLHVTTADPGCPVGYQAGPFGSCYKYTSPSYSCSSGTLSGSRCVTTTTTAASARCPSGFLTGAFGICYRYTAASARCPSGYDPPSQGICYKRTPAADPCPSGYALSDGQCSRSTLASSRCPSGYDPPSQGICYKRTPAADPCPSGYAHSDGQCSRSTLASSRCPSGYDPPSQGICYKRTPAADPCPSGYAHSDGQCSRSTLASSRCPSGYDPPSQGICYKRTPAADPCPSGYAHSDGQCSRSTLASSRCPSGYDPPSQGICYKRTPAADPCPSGYAHSDGQCSRSTLASSRCPSGYDPPSQGICYKRTPAADPCPSGYAHSDGQCSRSTLASSRCPSGYDPPSQGICYKRTAPRYTCTTGTPKGTKCITTKPATLTYTCTTGTPDSDNKCVTTTDADATCNTRTPVDGKCPHTHPTITGLDATGKSPEGVDYTDNFTVAPATSNVLVSGAGCALSGTAGSYTLTVSRADAGTRTCSIAAVDTLSTTTTATITFGDPPTITGLDATGSLPVGVDYTDNFTVAPATSNVLVSGAGCALSGTAGFYTLTVSRADAGTRTCSIAAVDTLSTTATATITFIVPPTITGLDATGKSAQGVDYTDNFTVAPATSNVLVSGAGCALSGTAGFYTLTVSRADAGTRTCSIAAVDTLSTTATATITFIVPPTITGLDATGKSAQGVDYTDNFTVAPATSNVLVSGAGCALSGTAGFYTLTVSRADAGTRTCSIAAVDTLSTTATATIAFGEPTLDPSLGVPSRPSVSCSSDGRELTVNWTGVREANGYEAQEDGGDLPDWSGSETSFTAASIPGGHYRWRIRSTGSGYTVSAWYSWAEGGCPVSAPSGLSVVCQASGKVAVSWDSVAVATQYTASITSTPPPARAAVSLESTRNLVPSDLHSDPPTSFELEATVGWTYSVQVKAQANNKWSSLSASAADTCEAVAPPAPTGVAASCSNRVLTVTWNSAGTGLAKATSYKARIFTGDPTIGPMSWTANTAGHSTTTATVPATGEGDLPTTGIFQVRVKAANTAGDSPYSDPIEATCDPLALSAPTELGAECRADGVLEVEWTTAVSISATPTRFFDVRSDEETVGSIVYVPGQAELFYEWDRPESAESYRVQVRERVFDSGETRTSPWTAVSTPVQCPTFVPRKLSVSCNSSGVVEANWDAVNGARSYRVDWRPQHEVGSDEIRTTTKVDPTWQEDEGGVYQLAVSAYAVANNMWSDYTDPVSVTCDEVALPGAWLSPNSNEDLVLDPDSVILYTELVTRFCPTTTSEEKAVRICTENWNEVIEVRVDNRSWWQKLPLAQWSDGYSIANNIRTLGGLVIALRGGRLPDGTYTTKAKFSVTKAGFKQGKGYAEAKKNGFVYFTLSAHPPQVNPPVAGQPPVTGCLQPGYAYRTRTLDRITKTDGNHTTHRDITIHYCVKP